MRKVWYHQIWIQTYFGFVVSDLIYMPRNYWSSLGYDLMTSIWEKANSILAGKLNSGRSYLITAVISWTIRINTTDSLISIVKRNFPGIFLQKNWLFLTVQQWCRVKHVACLLSPGTWRGSCTNYYDYRRWHGHHYSCSAFRIGYDVYAFALLVVILVL